MCKYDNSEMQKTIHFYWIISFLKRTQFLQADPKSEEEYAKPSNKRRASLKLPVLGMDLCGGEGGGVGWRL